MIRTKDNSVHLAVLTPALFRIFECLFIINNRKIEIYPEDFVITSINDSTSHSAKSKHYQNLAIDMRSKNFKGKESKYAFRDQITSMLGPKFFVLLENEGRENEHFHIQVAKGKEYP